jgi:hypothetical protein
VKTTIAIGVVALIAAVVVVVALLGGGSAVKNILPGHSTAPTPDFAFVTTKVEAIPTAAGAKLAKLKPAAQTAAKAASTALDALYSNAFLAPGNWQDGSYDDVWASFDGKASATAQQDLETLTAGTSAGDTYSDIQPARGAVKFSVLLDAKGQPQTVSATVLFTANATKKGGGTTLLRSEANYFLQRIGSAWKVVSFQVKRADVANAPTPSTSGSGSAKPPKSGSGGASPSAAAS